MENNKKDDAFEEILPIIYNKMINIDSDEDFAKIKKIYSDKEIIFPLQQLLFSEAMKRSITYPRIHRNFKGGKWDDKVETKKLADQHYHKIDKNNFGKPAAVFGTTMPGDDQYVYDHDLWGNISYGYMLKKAGLIGPEIEGAAFIDDLLQSIGKDGPLDLDDYKMVRIGIDLYNKYGDNLTEQDFRREIISQKDRLRRYDKTMLEDRRYRPEGGEDIDTIAKKHGITSDQLVEYNEKHKDGIRNLNREQSFLPNKIKPLLPDYMERSKMQQTPISHEKKSPFVYNPTNVENNANSPTNSTNGYNTSPQINGMEQVGSNLAISKRVDAISDFNNDGESQNVKDTLDTLGYDKKENTLTSMIKQFQQDNKLTVDGYMEPNGETVNKLNEIRSNPQGQSRVFNPPVSNTSEMTTRQFLEGMFNGTVPVTKTNPDTGFKSNYYIKPKDML